MVDEAAAIQLAQAQWQREPVSRPHGGNLLAGGGALFVAGLVALLIGVIAPNVSDPGQAGIGDLVAAVPPTYNWWKWPLTWAGAGAANLGVLLWALGQIVRALFFLPGRTVAVADLGGVNSLPPASGSAAKAE